MKTGQLIDRLKFAAELSRNKRVLDIGGQHPFDHDPAHKFCVAYKKISEESAEYEILDKENKEGVKYVTDLDSREGRELLAEILRDYRPDVLLCMEVFEHMKYPCEVMDIIGQWLIDSDAVFFMTLPNNGSWVLNALNWHCDHNVAFFKTIAQRFVIRSRLGKCDIEMYPCMQTYHWYWLIAYIAALYQPFNWGFKITAPKSSPVSCAGL